MDCPVKQGKAFVFTWNNPPDMFPEVPLGSKLVACLEVGDSGTPHWQGYITFEKNKTLSALKKISCESHWENRKGSHKEAYDYCIKGDLSDVATVFKFKGLYYKGNGVPICGSNMSLEQGHGKGIRNDLSVARERILQKRNLAECYRDEDLLEICCKYPRWVSDIRNFREVAPDKDVILREWQNSLVITLSAAPDPRHIHWIYDKKGNAGKSFLATHLQNNYGALVLCNGKTADIAHVFDSEPIVIFDLSRSMEAHVNYGVMEDLKNGRIFSPKYDSCVKRFAVPHVVVFANFKCPDGVFSEDRLQLVTLPLVNDLHTETTQEYIARLKRVKAAREVTAVRLQLQEAIRSAGPCAYSIGFNAPNRIRSPGMFDTNI